MPKLRNLEMTTPLRTMFESPNLGWALLTRRIRLNGIRDGCRNSDPGHFFITSTHDISVDEPTRFRERVAERSMGRYEKTFLAIRDSLEKTNARFIVVAAPYESQLRQDLLELDKEFTTTPQRMLKTMTSELNIPFLDLHPVFAVNSHKCLFRDGIHLANAGHRLVKDELVQFLTSESLVPDPIATEQQRISRIR